MVGCRTEGLKFLFVFYEAKHLLAQSIEGISAFYDLKKSFQFCAPDLGVVCVLNRNYHILLVKKNLVPYFKTVREERKKAPLCGNILLTRGD